MGKSRRGCTTMAAAVLLLWVLLLTIGTGVAQWKVPGRQLPDDLVVNAWANAIGDELWALAEAVLEPSNLEEVYKKEMSVRVHKKSGEELIHTISENVGRMLRRKMDAVRCVYEKAEEISDSWGWDNMTSKNWSYYSAKYSPSYDDQGEYKEPEIPEEMIKYGAKKLYRTMELEPDTHFNQVLVNTTFSAVHVPTNVYDQLPQVSSTIRWSEELDRIFRHNYRSDPALLWQYFCSTTGILRQYPAMRWPVGLTPDGNDVPDVYDCRLRSWFIEAATCSKDMLILVDISGSMAGMSFAIAKNTVATLLDTLSNNDFVTVLAFNETVLELVPCFEGRLVQATPENIKTFNLGLARKDVKPEGVANLTEAFTTAFQLLEGYRNEQRCGLEMPCNQLIMLVTDGIANNITEVFEEYNWQENGTIPVRVFTYLLGKEVTNVREIQWMACLNRGYYAHIHSTAEVIEQVLKYIPVVARPLVLNERDHPIVWTHAYVDIARAENSMPLEKDNKAILEGVEVEVEEVESGILEAVDSENWSDRLLTSVSIPVFDRQANRDSVNQVANLLGIVGTDVPLREIKKLTMPHKLGVNGYAFIVSNNGYVVLHPALKPESRGELKVNYNSIDLAELEILDDDSSGPRNIGTEIMELRNALVNHEQGKKLGVKVKIHYDDYRRVSLEVRDYFYAPLPLTPFGIAIALPDYSRHYIDAPKEVDRYMTARDKLMGFFEDNRWSLHPEWVYCRYHYQEDHEFDTQEAELRHFLPIVVNVSLTRQQRYPKQYQKYEPGTEFDPPYCGSNDAEAELEDYKRHLDDHYCDEELMHMLIFDARASSYNFSEKYKVYDPVNTTTIHSYRAFIRFIAMQSGFMRWQFINSSGIPDRDERINEFIKNNRRAIHEPWYKGSIFQSEIHPDSVSITVPKGSGISGTVTVAHGVYAADNQARTPGAVIGFQMPVSALYKKINALLAENATSGMNCMNVDIDCYLIDQNGYIVLSLTSNYDAGKFFGSLDQTAAIMKSLIKQGLFHAVDLYDYTGVCYDYVLESSASFLQNPFRMIWNLASGLLMRLLMILSSIYEIPPIWATEEEPDFTGPPKLHWMKYSRACDKKMTVYVVDKKKMAFEYTNRPEDCSLPFWVREVKHTNLLLVVVRTTFDTCWDRLDSEPEEIMYYWTNGSIKPPPCHKLALNDLPRRRLKKCFTTHENESEILACGGSAGIRLSVVLVVLVSMAAVLQRHDLR